MGSVNLVEAQSYVPNEQQNHFRAIHVAIVQYDADVLPRRALPTAEYKVHRIDYGYVCISL